MFAILMELLEKPKSCKGGSGPQAHMSISHAYNVS